VFSQNIYASLEILLKTPGKQISSKSNCASGLLIGDDRAGIAIGFQKLPDHSVERDGVRAGQS
jgi:hypothetical protein